MRRVKIPLGVRITPEPAQKSAPWLVADRPWEEGLSGYHTVIHDEGRYRCWYLVRITPAAREQMFPQGVKAAAPGHVFGYAESADGSTALTWRW
jgi:hypothetical protein